MDTIIKKYILDSFEKLNNYDRKDRYFHDLTPEDNSPVVVHNRTNQLTYVLSGEGVAILNGITQKIEKDSLIFIEAGTKHQFIAMSNKMTLFHIHIPDEGRENDRFILEGEDYRRYE